MPYFYVLSEVLLLKRYGHLEKNSLVLNSQYFLRFHRNGKTSDRRYNNNNNKKVVQRKELWPKVKTKIKMTIGNFFLMKKYWSYFFNNVGSGFFSGGKNEKKILPCQRRVRKKFPIVIFILVFTFGQSFFSLDHLFIVVVVVTAVWSLTISMKTPKVLLV